MGRLHKSGAFLSPTKTADIFPFLCYTVKNIGRRKTYEITPEGELALRIEYGRLKALIRDSRILEEGDEIE